MWSKSSLSLWLPTSSLFSSWNPCVRADQPCCGHLEPRSARLCSPHRLLALWWRHWSGCQLSSRLWWWSRWWLRRSTSPPCSLPRPTWQWPSSLPGNPAEHSIGHTWLSCGTFRGSFLGLNWSQRQFLLLLRIPPPPHCPISMRTYILSSGGLRRGQRLHCWLLEEKTWVSISWKLTSIQCSFVTLVSFHSLCYLLKARQQGEPWLI